MPALVANNSLPASPSRTPHELKMMGEHPDCIYFEEMPLPRPRPK
jgi:hypothetical protein